MILFKGGHMSNNTFYILFILLLSVITNATDTNLNTNTNFLLLLLLALNGQNYNWGCGCGQNTCPGQSNNTFF